jgi:outer membrane receptor protein involved in Fe transport
MVFPGASGPRFLGPRGDGSNREVFPARLGNGRREGAVQSCDAAMMTRIMGGALRMKAGPFGLLLCACATLPAPSRAQPGDSPPRVEVTEQRALLPGLGVARDRLPYTVEQLGRDAINNENAVSLPDLMGQRLPSVNVNEIQGNPFQADLNYRGFSASPLLGTPQGLSVFLDGVRVNEAFGDIVNWDLLPQAAIADLTLMPGSNPLFGLNTLGAAIALRTKSGDTHPGGEIEAYGGSFGRVSGQFEYGSSLDDGMHVYAAGTYFNENGWRDYSPSTVGQFFAKVGRRTSTYDIGLSFAGADTELVGNGLVPQSMLAQSQTGIFTRPDQTKNQLGMVNLSGSALLAGGSKLAGLLYYRSVRTRTFNGDVNDDFEDDVEVDVDALPGVNNRSSTDQTSGGAAVQWSVLAGINQIAVGASYDGSRSTFQQGAALGTFDPTRAVIDIGPYGLENALTGRVDNFGLYATDTVTVLPNLFLTLSGRYNVTEVKMQDTGPSAPALDGEHRYTSFNPAIGASYQFMPAMTLYGGFAQGSRAPSPIELGCADPENPCTLPNALASDPPLNQVITRTFELGLRGRVGDSLRWNAGVFQAINDDDILFVGTTTSAGYFTNIGKTRRQGVELGASGTSGALEWGASYSYIQASYRSNSCIVSANNSARGTSTQCSPQDPNDPSVYLGDDLIAVTSGARMPGVPTQSLKLNAAYAVNDRWRIGLQFVAFSSIYVRGNENNRHERGTYTDLNGISRTFLGPGYAPGYGVLNLATRYAVTPDLELYARLANVFNKQYATAGALAENPFNASGEFETDPELWQRETFYAPGAPRAAWIGLRYRF